MSDPQPTEQREDCDPFCMAPFGSHHDRCPAARERVSYPMLGDPDVIVTEVPATMTVRVFDRAAEAASWGNPGGGHPIVRSLIISTTCPTCGGVRGEPKSARSGEDGEWYSVDVWTNPCGHADPYTSVVREAAENGLN